jgi:hypothetical protein
VYFYYIYKIYQCGCELCVGDRAVQCLSFHPDSWPQTSLGNVLRCILKLRDITHCPLWRMATDILNEILQEKRVSELQWGLVLGLETKVVGGVT